MLKQLTQHHDDSADVVDAEPTIALIPWGDVWEDFLDSIGVSLETFCEEGPGGWILGYIQSLRLAGVRTVLVLFSISVLEPTKNYHEATGATILILPASKAYLTIRRHMVAPFPSFGGDVEQLFGNAHGAQRILFKAFKEIVPYLTTPFGVLASELRQEGCCAIFCQEYEYARFDVCVLWGQWLSLPVFASFQGGFGGNMFSRLVRLLTMKACAGVVIGAQEEIQRVQNLYKLADAKVAQIFNPIDLELWRQIDRREARSALSLPDDALVVVWHGRIEMHRKGLDILLEVWDQVQRERPEQDLRLLLVGMGTDAEKLRRRLTTLPKNSVHWIEQYVDRFAIRQLLSAGDIYAFPSRREGFPVAPIEAMACGLPVVASQASGVADILKDGEASGGIVVPCGDPAAFASALGYVLDNKNLRQEWSKRARKRVEDHFSFEVVGKKLRNFLLQEPE